MENEVFTRPELDLGQIERKAYLAVWDDGLIDLFVGVACVLMSVLWVFLDAVYGSLVAPVMVPLWAAARKHFSEPRIGVVKFGEERVRTQNSRLLGLFGVGVTIFAIAILLFVLRADDAATTSRNIDANLAAGLPAALLALPVALVAVIFDLKRFLAYALVLLVSAIPVIVLDLHPGWAFLPAGLAGIWQGAILLKRFRRKYSVKA